ncbi:MAG: hypothetical protein KJP02_04480 [Octadecabacter sp.]|nr:hypothetical protein [Octadecabacter sp.]
MAGKRVKPKSKASGLLGKMNPFAAAGKKTGGLVGDFLLSGTYINGGKGKGTGAKRVKPK